MRPIRLELEGFGAFRSTCVIDFDDCDFFALVGPTGSGKSTVLDAICFALYGTVPRYEDRRLVAPYVNVQAVEAKVALTFEVDHVRYIAVRILRRGKGGRVAMKELRLERFDDQGNTEVLAAKDAEFDTAIVELLGLSFEQFTTCVLLPQGAFARFLHERPSERQDLLVKLLGLSVYEQMAQLARERAGALEASRRDVKSRLEVLVDATPDALEVGRARMRELDELLGEIDGELPALDALERRRSEASAEVERLAPFIQRLSTIETPASVVEGTSRLDDARTRAASAAEATAAAVSARELAESGLAAAPPEAELVRANVAHERLLVARRECARTDEGLAKAAAREKVAASILARAIDAETAAALAVATAERAEMASVLADAISVGKPCPVCGQTVHQVPRPHDAPERAATERVLRSAKAAAAAAQSDIQHLAAERAGVTQRHQGLLSEIGRLAESVVAYPDRSAAELALQHLGRLKEAATAARREEHDRYEVLTAARQRLDQVAAELKHGLALLHERRDPLGALGPPPIDNDNLLASWKSFGTWAASQRLELSTRQERCRAEATSVVEQIARTAASLATSLSVHNVPLSSGAPVPALRDAVVRAGADAATRVERIGERIAERTALEHRDRSTADAHAVATKLAQLLSAKGFERWLVNEALSALVADASITMRRLTGEQFSLAFAESGDIDVIDHVNADERRPARSLSGGETFQAALALALALSDRLAELASGGAAQLDAIFLDEGFGSLDVDTLEAVASTIEALAADGSRMVGIVTHVQELAERVPVRFVVNKGAGTASIERVSA